MNKYLSKKEYLKKYDSNVGYALYVENNIKRDNYVRLNTGKIVKVIGIKENKLNKKAIYFGIYEQDWFDSMAVENFSDKIIDLIKKGDYVNGNKVLVKERTVGIGVDTRVYLLLGNAKIIHNEDIKTIVTKEQMASIEYKVESEEK